MNKICTSIEQSKKLIELGIDVNTADMIYQPIMDIDSMSNVGFDKTPLCFSFNEVKECNIQYLPAWSLSALIWLMPERIKIGEELSFCLASKKSLTGFSFGYNLNGSTFVKDNPIDAAFEMVCWLKAEKYI